MTPEEWTLDWIRRNVEASCVNQQFHDDFHAQFGGARTMYPFGACPVHKAQRLLAQMAKEGKLVTRVISLGGNWQPGFPKWVRSYSRVA